MVRERWRTRIWAGLLVLFGIGLGQAPLFATLGFELAVVAAAAAAIVGLDVGAALAREIQRESDSTACVWRGTAAASALAVGLATLPGIACAIRGLWAPTCDWTFGLQAYAAMPLVTAALAGAVGHAVGVVAGPRRFLGAFLAQVPLFFLVIAGLYRFYSAPPVFSYSPILGYFPGNMYDENVQLTWPLAWARFEQLAWVVTAVAALWLTVDPSTYRVRWPRVSKRLGVLATALVAGIVLHAESGRLGYAIEAEDVENGLDGYIETAHFEIYYAKTDDIEHDIELIAEDHELRYAEVVAQTGMAPAGKLRSFYFANGDQKARWMGARDVEMAKPWRGEIYLDHRAFPHSSLRHEIAHAIAAAFGDEVFHVAAGRFLTFPILINPGLVEGLAVALDWPGGYDRLTPHEAVRAMAVMGLEPSLNQLLSLEFFTVSSARGYTTAGSFLKFLLDTYGAAPLRDLYRSGGDFQGSYGKPFRELEAEWRKMIDSIQLPPDIIEAQRERFRSVSVFSRPCPHAIAAARDKAFSALSAGEHDKAIEILRDVCSRAPEEPRYRLELGQVLATGDDDDKTEAKALWDGLVADPENVTSSLRGDALDRLAHMAGSRGDLVEAKRLVGAARKLPIDANERRQLDGEWFALDSGNPMLVGYFFRDHHGPDTRTWARLATLAYPMLGFAHYLLGLQETNAGDYASSARELALAIRLGLPDVQFERNAARRLAIAAYRVHDEDGVKTAARTLFGPRMTTVDRLLATDWLTRLAFDKRFPMSFSSR